LRGAEQASTRRTYSRVLRWVVAEFGAESGPGEIDPERFAGWFTAQWAHRAPSTWNVSLDAVRSAAAYWQRQGWLAADFSRQLERRKPRPDRSRALSRAEVEQLLTREDIGLRERTLWRMLYETAARSAELLALDVEDLDLPNRRARVRRKGGAIDVIVWQTGTARLLPRGRGTSEQRLAVRTILRTLGRRVAGVYGRDSCRWSFCLMSRLPVRPVHRRVVGGRAGAVLLPR
jgi:integrase